MICMRCNCSRGWLGTQNKGRRLGNQNKGRRMGNLNKGRWLGNLNKGKQDAKGRGISLLLLPGSSIQVLDFQSLFLRFIIYDHASKEKRKSRSEKQMMLLPNTEKAIFQGVEQRSLDQVFPSSPRLIHAIVGRLPWCTLSIYDGQLRLYQGGILSTQCLEDYNTMVHGTVKAKGWRAPMVPATVWACMMVCGASLSSRGWGGGEGRGVQKEKVRL